MAVRLPTLMGRRDVLAQARSALGGAPRAAEAVDALEHLAELVLARCPTVELRFDIAELAGYGYHNGAVFSAFQADRGSALARGGRYDGIGAAFGRARAATGFDVSLKQLLRGAADAGRAIWVPWLDGTAESRQALLAELSGLRESGEIVVCAVRQDERPPERCDRTLTEAGGVWTVRPLN